MTQIFWENKVIVCDICKERPLKKVIEISRGKWVGVCSECDTKKEIKDKKN